MSFDSLACEPDEGRRHGAQVLAATRQPPPIAPEGQNSSIARSPAALRRARSVSARLSGGAWRPPPARASHEQRSSETCTPPCRERPGGRGCAVSEPARAPSAGVLRSRCVAMSMAMPSRNSSRASGLCRTKPMEPAAVSISTMRPGSASEVPRRSTRCTHRASSLSAHTQMLRMSRMRHCWPSSGAPPPPPGGRSCTARASAALSTAYLPGTARPVLWSTSRQGAPCSARPTKRRARLQK
mmetsp:Transcript_115021/g.325800  ORF Transcript_115021/g.325800 Transcript_115021/m.325800 type:complete len:241 (+) Transcript_115021:69-791(+)